MTAYAWISGPPPHIGWWQASVCQNPRFWRWWNGEYWSDPAQATYTPDEAEQTALFTIAFPQIAGKIRWTYYWPEGAPERRAP